jgi:ATP-dependent Lon protease
VVAASRAGIHRVLLPARNRKDFEDIPEEARNAMSFVWLQTVDEAISAALEPKTSSAKKAEVVAEA